MNIGRLLDFIIGIPVQWILPLILRPSTSDGEIRKILLIKLAAVGDTILLMPLIKSLREKYPEIEIDWLVTPINQTVAGIVKETRRQIVWDRKLNNRFLMLMRELRRTKYDAVIDLEQWSRGSAIIAYATGAPRRFGFDTPGQHRTCLFTNTYRKTFHQHEIKDFMGLVSLLLPLERCDPPELLVPEEGRRELEELKDEFKLRDNQKPKIILHPGCGHDGLPREWPLNDYVILANWLLRKFNANLIITAGPEEKGKSAKLLRLINGEGVDAGGRLSWLGLIALVKEVDLVISGNTGIMHIAAALKKPQVALHGPTDPVLWGPLNDKARVVRTTCPSCPCLKLGFEYHRKDSDCMKKINVESVKEAVQSLFDNDPSILIEGGKQK